MSFIIRLLKVLAALGIIALGVWFAVENSEPVRLVIFGFASPELKLGFWVLSAFLLGAALGIVAGIGPRVGAARKIKRHAAQLKKSEAELSRLRVDERDA